MSHPSCKVALRTGIVFLAILAFGVYGRGQAISNLYKFAKTRDTTYYVSPPGKYSVFLVANLVGSRMGIYGKEDNNSKMRTHISSKSMVNNTIIVGYRGIAIGYSFNPYSSSKKSDDKRFSLTLHGNFLGIDFGYYNIKSFSGYSRMGSQRMEIPYGDPAMKLLMVNSYVVFNHKHYSFPAGASQSYIQKKSSGSLLAGVTYSYNKTSASSVGISGESLKVNAKTVSIGAGYGYNYVPGKNYLIAVTLMPKFVVYDSSNLDLDRYNVRKTFSNPQFTYSGSLAAVRHIGKFCLAVSALADGLSSNHSSSSFILNQLQWQVHAYFGVNF